MTRTSVIEISKEGMGFSAGHFTIFSATKRENLHGHNYQLYCALTTTVADIGITFDYRYYNKKLEKLCEKLQQTFLLPTKSPYLKIEEDGDYLYAHFNQEKIPFLKKDVVLLPLRNITVEELSFWFLELMLQEKDELAAHAIQEIVIKISSSPGRSGSASWKEKNES